MDNQCIFPGSQWKIFPGFTTSGILEEIQSTHTVKEQFVPEENRDIASFNADNEFNRAIDEENIDFTTLKEQEYYIQQWHDHMASTFKI